MFFKINQFCTTIFLRESLNMSIPVLLYPSLYVVCYTNVNGGVISVGHYVDVVCFIHMLKISPLTSFGRNDSLCKHVYRSLKLFFAKAQRLRRLLGDNGLIDRARDGSRTTD